MPVRMIGDAGSVLGQYVGDYSVIGALQAAGADDLADMLAGKNYNKINAPGDFGVAAYLALPMLGGGSKATTVAWALTAQPARAVKPDRLTMGSTLGAINVTGFTIANTNQFLQNVGDVPSEAFSALAVATRWDFTACPVNSSITIAATNSNTATNIMFATLSGPTVQM